MHFGTSWLSFNLEVRCAAIFTSEPVPGKVADYLGLISPVVPSGKSADKGDVRLSFTLDTDESGWVVEKHSVRV